ncbi:uncharacterized protein V3H82_013789 [Fundulus diaphanus]
MKLLFQLCFLVLAIPSVAGAQNLTETGHNEVETDKNGLTKDPPATQQLNETTQIVDPDMDEKGGHNVSKTRLALNQTMEEATNTSETGPLTPTTVAPTSPTSSATRTGGEKSETNQTKESTSASASTTIAPTSSSPVVVATSGSSLGYGILVFMIILIVTLCIILYMLRRASRTYSFDLQRPVPVSNPYEPTGTFGQVYLDDLDRPVPKDGLTEDPPTTPVPNGTSPPTQEKAASEENAPQEPAAASDPQNLSSSNSSSLSEDFLDEKKSNQMSSNNLFFDASEEPPQQQKNENNNNPSVCSSDPFVEINLDEPAWSELLSSPQPTSSVLPFSSFSSSTSGSS